MRSGSVDGMFFRVGGSPAFCGLGPVLIYLMSFGSRQHTGTCEATYPPRAKREASALIFNQKKEQVHQDTSTATIGAPGVVIPHWLQPHNHHHTTDVGTLAGRNNTAAHLEAGVTPHSEWSVAK